MVYYVVQMFEHVEEHQKNAKLIFFSSNSCVSKQFFFSMDDW
jgi:hypothetical protein